MAKKKETAAVLDLPVNYGNLSVGDKTCRVGVTIDRSEISLTAADKNLCERRLTCTITAKPAGWNADQQALDGMDDEHTVRGIVDVKGISVSADHIGCGLSFNIGDVDVSTLAHFAKRAGRLRVLDVAVIPEAEKNGDGDE